MEKEITAVAVIPAKMDSTRLARKNMQLVGGKTLIEHAIDYALDSEYVTDVLVSTESKEVEDMVKGLDLPRVRTIGRADHLLGDAEVCDVYVDVARVLFAGGKTYGYLVGLQPDNLFRQNPLDKMLDYVREKKYNDLVTVDSRGFRSGATRIIEFIEVLRGKISRRMGCYMEEGIKEVHTKEELEDICQLS